MAFCELLNNGFFLADKGIDLMKEQSVNYLKKSSIKRGSYVLDMKRSTLVSLEH